MELSNVGYGLFVGVVTFWWVSLLFVNMAGFGMRLETGVDGYQRSECSVKYGFLFISLTFFTLFLFEVMTGRPLHPVPYVLTGAALTVFYLVGLMMGLTYALLYILVTAAHAALLLGSVALLIAIAGLMYLTRGVDWYGYGGEEDNCED